MFHPARQPLIAARLDKLLRQDIGIPVSDVPAADWGAVRRSTGEWFGFLWPLLHEGQVISVYSSEVIATQTAWLQDSQLVQYLDLLEYCLSHYLTLMSQDPEADPDDLRRAVEAALWDLRHAAMHWLTEVQMRILDHAIQGEPAA